ncbi:MAG TPA: hypothetical protein VNI02_00370 [Blastocatellia bacterium]|nr:hypothetical protein [Blastocatellia bacterium]
MLKLSLFGLLALAFSCCRGTSREEQGGLLQSSDAPSVEDSGRKISGEFVLKGIEDDYGNKNPQGRAASTFRFEEGGGFKIERESGASATRVEEGTYVIGKRNELVLYVEKVGGELLSEARVYRYVIADQSGDRMRLQSSPSATLVLQKK